MMNIRRAAAVLLALLMLLLTPAALAKTITVDAADYDVEEGGRYDTMEEVAIYLTFFDELPDALGWLGVALVLTALVLLNLPARRREKQTK